MARKKRVRKRGVVRRSRAKLRTGWSRRELAALTGVSMRAITDYVKRGLLPAVVFRGRGSRYEREHLLALLAIKRLRGMHGTRLQKIKGQLSALEGAQLEAFAVEGLGPGAVADALGMQRADVKVEATADATIAIRRSAIGAAVSAARWQRIELALGLELHVRDDASAAVLNLVERLREVCLR